MFQLRNGKGPILPVRSSFPKFAILRSQRKESAPAAERDPHTATPKFMTPRHHDAVAHTQKQPQDLSLIFAGASRELKASFDDTGLEHRGSIPSPATDCGLECGSGGQSKAAELTIFV